MKTIICISLLAAAALAGCDRPKTGTSDPGTVANRPASKAMTADSTSPPKAAASDLSAPPGEGKTPNDAVVAGKVKAAIGGDAGMKGTDISVKAEGGVVQLNGTAPSPDQVTLAAALAQRQEGVKRVENQVEVK